MRKMRAPYMPDTSIDNFDTNHVNNSEWKDQDAVKENELQLRRDSIQELFKGYYFNKHDVQAPKPEHRESMHNQTSTKLTTAGVSMTGNEPDSPKLLKGKRREEIDEDYDSDPISH
jgi:hypothetical protein